MAVLPVSDIVNIIVNLSARSTLRKAFNLALYMGTSNVIPLEERVRVYSGLDSMLDDGFTTAMPEYKAAAIFFQQSTKPKRLAIGCWDDQTEEILDAITAIRAANSEWYALLPSTQAETDILTLAAFVESAQPASMMAFVSPTADTIAKIKGLNLRRTMGIVSPQENMHMGIIGWAMGAQTGLRDSAYTLHLKKIVGLSVDPWKYNDLDKFKAANANYYINRGDTYDVFEEGVLADGTFFDELINLDYLANDLQLACMDKLTQVKKVAQTTGGMEILRNCMVAALEKMKLIGFIAPGIYTGDPFMEIETGQMLSKGYVILNDSIDEQSVAERENRISPPFYIIVKLAGAVHTMTVQVNVNR